MAQHKRTREAQQIGERLRSARHDRSETLAGISGRAGISISALSKIENGQTSTSYDILKRLCDALGVGLEDIVSPGEKSQLSGRKTTTRAGEGDHFQSDQYDYRVHASEISRKAMVPLEMVVRARTVEEFDHWSEHKGEEFVYVLSGAIEIHTEHYTPFRLAAGESAYFDSGMKHVYLCVGEGDARVLSVSHDPASAQRADVAQYMSPGSRKREMASE
ncbi:MAG: helix-turn-helix transcriptional regulator [Novosphingobium sp.]|nr:helix-turn-helix transcriptional regulator [Novosphingobium sp.]